MWHCIPGNFYKLYWTLQCIYYTNYIMKTIYIIMYEKYLKLNLKNKKNWRTKLNKYHYLRENLTHKLNTRIWTKLNMCYSKITKNEATCQRYPNLKRKLGSACVDINEIMIFSEKPSLKFLAWPEWDFCNCLGTAHQTTEVDECSVNFQWAKM